MTNTVTHDVIVLGGGSGGYAAARTARDAGADVAIVDPGPLGGLCILRGCMPSKAILRSSDVMSLARRGAEFGLLPLQPQADLGAIVARKDALIRDFADYRIEQLRAFTLYEEYGRFVALQQVQVGDRTLCAERFVIATTSPDRLTLFTEDDGRARILAARQHTLHRDGGVPEQLASHKPVVVRSLGVLENLC